MSDFSDVQNIIDMLDNMTESGVGRIKVKVTDDVEKGQVRENYHHGRCDVGSPFATGCIPNFEEQDS